MTQVILIRHAKTEGNLCRKYVGRTDESLCRKGQKELKALIREGIYPPMKQDGLLFVSPMKRCRETASMIYPEAVQHVVEDFRECDFGDFEYKNYEELQGNDDYQAWIDSGGTRAFPGGEDPERFQDRCLVAFQKIMKKYTNSPQIILVVHGGIVMSVLSTLGEPEADFYSWSVENGHGYVCEKTESGRLIVVRQV